MTPPGTSEVSSTWYKSVAARGNACEGTATTAFPTATAGSTVDSSPSSGYSSGQAIPITPTGSFMARVTFRTGVACTAPSHLSAQAAYE